MLTAIQSHQFSRTFRASVRSPIDASLADDPGITRLRVRSATTSGRAGSRRARASWVVFGLFAFVALAISAAGLAGLLMLQPVTAQTPQSARRTPLVSVVETGSITETARRLGRTQPAISQAVAHAGFYYAPAPSSQIACSIGGNVAENSGGVHCLKYGMTTNNVLGCEIVLMSGEILRIGGKAADSSSGETIDVVNPATGELIGVWDTNSGNPIYWALGTAPSLDGALVNNPATMTVSFAVADGANFVLFGADLNASVLAFVISIAGVFGGMAFLVSGRTREIGIRLALGAQRGAIGGGCLFRGDIDHHVGDLLRGRIAPARDRGLVALGCQN